MEQESQKRKLDGSSCNSANAPILCANNCGFFASASTNNLCSKCYKEFLAQQTKVSDDNVLGKEIAEVKQLQVVEGGTTSENPDKIPTANRCGFCRKRVGLTGFKCKCGQTFCFLHRYSDKHNCMFDYKSAGQDAIAKANPIVKRTRLRRYEGARGRFCRSMCLLWY